MQNLAKIPASFFDEPIVTQTKDVEFVNKVINHPEVHRWVAFDGQTYLDASPFLLPPHIVLKAGDGGVFIFMCHEPGVYEVHTNFLPGYRGKFALHSAKLAAEYMFINTDCMEILTKVPADNIGADRLTRAMGFSFEFKRENAWTRKGESIDANFYALRYPEWTKQVSDVLEVSGQWFHDELLRQKKKLGLPDEQHPHDLAHDISVGACVKMILASNVGKGIILYNRWARFAGYSVIKLQSTNPLKIDIEECVLRVVENYFVVEGICQ